MKQDRTAFERSLHRHLGLFVSPSANQLEASRGRIREYLRVHQGGDARRRSGSPDARRADRTPLVAAGRARSWWPIGSIAAAAALIAIAIWTARALIPATGADAVRSGREPRDIPLADGSRVEMRPHSELLLDRTADGIGINLRTGGIIVNAAKQRSGHLYVRTKDITVSVVGTVFVVNAAADGSRVGVIEGEVRVREEAREPKIEMRLHPGQHVSTSRRLAARPLEDDIAWSRHADVHLAILASFSKGMAATSAPLTPLRDTRHAQPAQATQSAPPGPAFEEASVRQCDPDNLPETPAGARGGGPNSLLMTPGHLYVQCMTLATLVRTALGYGPVELEFRAGQNSDGRRAGRGMRFENVYGLGVEDGRRVRGGPHWIREDRYTIEAVGDGQATAEMMRGEMLRDLLERRFQLKAHIESEQIPAYALVVGPGGLKPLKPFRQSDCAETSDSVKAERARKGWTGPVLITEAAYFGVKPNCGGVYGETNGPNYHFEMANSPPGIVAGFVGMSMGVRVVDRTNITDRYTFTWDFGIDEQTPRALEDLQRGKTWSPKPGWDSPMSIPKAPSIFAAVEQLGLKMEPIRVPREFIVIDRVERPSPN
jgi:uncharacterized protein (TIGR03435 family)